MIARSCSKVALIIDHDLGFLMWLGEIFSELGCQAFPALGCRQALALAVRWKLPITTLVVNPELRGARRAAQALMATNPEWRVVLIRDSTVPGDGPADPPGIQASSTLVRPSPGESISNQEWAAKLRKTLL